MNEVRRLKLEPDMGTWLHPGERIIHVEGNVVTVQRVITDEAKDMIAALAIEGLQSLAWVTGMVTTAIRSVADTAPDGRIGEE